MTTRWQCTFDDELSLLAQKHGTDKIKWYTSFYHSLLKDRRDAKKVLELGILNGASLRMWQDYFPEATIYGLDIDRSTHLNEGRIKSLWFNQADEMTYPLICDLDFIVDDASHAPEHQMTALLTLVPMLKPNGIYIVEDTGYMNAEQLAEFSHKIPYPNEAIQFVNPELNAMGDKGSCVVIRP